MAVSVTLFDSLGHRTDYSTSGLPASFQAYVSSIQGHLYHLNSRAYFKVILYVIHNGIFS